MRKSRCTVGQCQRRQRALVKHCSERQRQDVWNCLLVAGCWPGSWSPTCKAPVAVGLSATSCSFKGADAGAARRVCRRKSLTWPPARCCLQRNVGEERSAAALQLRGLCALCRLLTAHAPGQDSTMLERWLEGIGGAEHVGPLATSSPAATPHVHALLCRKHARRFTPTRLTQLSVGSLQHDSRSFHATSHVFTRTSRSVH